MFGVVPRALWSKVCPPDEDNRITMNMNCVFIDTGKERMLIETGIGEKWSAKHSAMFGITRERSLRDSLRAIAGVEADNITIVINTHLHFDHAGGNTTLNGNAEQYTRFPTPGTAFRAVGRPAEVPATNRASYLPDNLRRCSKGSVVIEGRDYEVVPVLRMQPTGSQSIHGSVAIESGGRPCLVSLIWCHAGSFPLCYGLLFFIRSSAG